MKKRKLSLLCVFGMTIFSLLLSNTGFAKDIAADPLVKSGKAFAAVAKSVTPGVVSIKAEIQQVSGGAAVRPEELSELPPMFEEFFKHFNEVNPNPENQMQTVIGFGSGFLISADGYIITNNHVIENAVKITVTMHDDKEHVAKLIGTDKRSDVAVIKIDGKNFSHLKMGNSDNIEVGEWVLAVGSPLGLSHSISAGIVSAIGRSKLGITEYDNLIQTDAAINQGNSGGPLINLSSEVIGINTAIVSKSGGNMGIGFAIPANMAKDIAQQIIDNGSVSRGYLGVRIQDLTAQLAQSFGLSDAKGVIIALVEEGSPAAKVGLKQGDVILVLDNKEVKDITTFRNTVAFSKPGTKHNITVRRKNQDLKFTVTMAELPESNTKEKSEQPVLLQKLGVSVSDLNNNLQRNLGLSFSEGVVIVDVSNNSIGQLAGLKRGDVIVQANGAKIKNIQEIRELLDSIKQNGALRLLVEDRNGPRFIGLNLN